MKIVKYILFIIISWIAITGSIILTKINGPMSNILGYIMLVLSIAWMIDKNPWKEDLLNFVEQEKNYKQDEKPRKTRNNKHKKQKPAT